MNSFIKRTISQGAVKKKEKRMKNQKDRRKKFGGAAGYYTS